MTIKNWLIEEETGYKPMHTFYEDLSIADAFGASAVLDTYKRVMKEWSKNYKALTEFVMALNWKIWEHYKSEQKLALVYNELYFKAKQYAEDHLKGEELSYFIRTTD